MTGRLFQAPATPLQGVLNLRPSQRTPEAPALIAAPTSILHLALPLLSTRPFLISFPIHYSQPKPGPGVSKPSVPMSYLSPGHSWQTQKACSGQYPGDAASRHKPSFPGHPRGSGSFPRSGHPRPRSFTPKPGENVFWGRWNTVPRRAPRKTSSKVGLPGGHTRCPVTAGLWEPLLPEDGRQHRVHSVRARRAECGRGAGRRGKGLEWF